MRHIILLVFAMLIATASSTAAAPLRIAYSAISGAMSSLWVAQEGGYFSLLQELEKSGWFKAAGR